MQGGCQGFVVRENAELPPLKEKTEVAESQIGGQELTVKGGVLLLGRGELFGEKIKGKPGSFNHLLEDDADVGGGGVHGEGDLGGGGRVDQGHSCDQGSLGGLKGCLEGRRPRQRLGGTSQRVSQRLEDASEARDKTAVKIDQT